MTSIDICPKCGIEGDPIEAINCKPVKWCCPECKEKWTAPIVPELQGQALMNAIYEKYPNI